MPASGRSSFAGASVCAAARLRCRVAKALGTRRSATLLLLSPSDHGQVRSEDLAETLRAVGPPDRRDAGGAVVELASRDEVEPADDPVARAGDDQGAVVEPLHVARGRPLAVG